jgi:transcriptional regulator with GAF, ATPase, and Fis domain
MPAAEASPVGAATHRDLNAEIERGKFREDLFYRLNVFPLEVPPLRERREDIPLLVNYFLDRYARKAGKSIRRVNKRALQHLQAFNRIPGRRERFLDNCPNSIANLGILKRLLYCCDDVDRDGHRQSKAHLRLY